MKIKFSIRNKKPQGMKKALILFGLLSLASLTFSTLLTFYLAYFHNYTAIIYVNYYNEAIFEFYILPVVFIWGLWSIKEVVKEMV